MSDMEVGNSAEKGIIAVAIFGSFLKNKQGNFAALTALAFPAIFAAVVFAVDISNQLRSRTELQDSNDAAVLYAAQYYQEYRKLPTNQQVTAFMNGNTLYPITVLSLTIDKQTEEVTLSSRTSLKPMLANFFGRGLEDYNAFSKANSGVAGILEFALALDVTGSMKYDGRISGLKVAATEFLDMVHGARERGSEIRGAVVPFARYVNVGVSRRGESWMEVPPDIDTRWTEERKYKKRDVVGQTCEISCSQAYVIHHPAIPASPPTGPTTINHPGTPGSCTTDDGVQSCSAGTAGWTQTIPGSPGSPAVPAWTQNVPSSCGQNCTTNYGPEYEVTEYIQHGELITWHGCVGSRNGHWNLKDEEPNRRFPGPLGIQCNVELLPLTNNFVALRERVNALTPYDETYIPDGVMWGLRTLTPLAPFVESQGSVSSSKHYRKVLIVMTDGMNTVSPNGILHTGANGLKTDVDTKKACQEAKDKGIEVYAITFGSLITSRSKDLLKNCASEDEKYYHAPNSVDLKKSFKDIAKSLMTVRLTQ